MLIFKVAPASINPSVPIFITHLPLYSIFQHPLYSIFQHPLRPEYVPQVDKSKDVCPFLLHFYDFLVHYFQNMRQR